MIRFSANLGFLWQELDFCDAIRAALKAGFDAVECHWPYQVPAKQVADTLQETGLPLLGLNTAPGDTQAGEFGLSALPGQQQRAQAAIDEALDYALITRCRNVHVMAGKTDGSDVAEAVYRENLLYACQQAARHGIEILIEPINNRDVPGYHLVQVETAIRTIEAVGCENLKLMFDCYHTQIMQGDISWRLQTCLPYIGHVQIASVPGRNEPDQGELDYRKILGFLDEIGYQGYVGAEYRPASSTERGLGWLKQFRT